MRRVRPAILALFPLLAGLFACLLLLDQEPPSTDEERAQAAADPAGPQRSGVAAQPGQVTPSSATRSSATPSSATRSSAAASAPRATVPAPATADRAAELGPAQESEGRVTLSVYAGQRLFLQPADVQLEATLGGEPCRVELVERPDRALEARLEVRWVGARSPRLVVSACLRQDPRARDVFQTFLDHNEQRDSLLDLELRHELTVRCDRPLAEGEIQAHLLDDRGQSRRSWDVELGEGGPSSVATFRGLPPGDYRLLALGQDDEQARRIGEARVRLAGGRPGLVDLALQPSARLEVRIVGPKGEAAGANLCIEGEPFFEEPEQWAERRFAEEEDYERQPAELHESSYVPPGEAQRFSLPPGRWSLRAAGANPAWTGAALTLELAAGERQQAVLRLGREAPTLVRLSAELSSTTELQLDAPAGASLVYRSARELLVRGLAQGAQARLLALRRANREVTIGHAELRGGQAAELRFVAPARAAITLLEPSGELAERLEGVELIPTLPAIPDAYRLVATPDDLPGHPESWGAHAWATEDPHDLTHLAGRALGETDEAGRWRMERLLPGPYRVALVGWPGADFDVELAPGRLTELRHVLR